MLKANGGFPPITYCPVIKSSDSRSDDKKITHERLFASDNKKNINIRQILKENNTKPVIDLFEIKNDDIEIVNVI
jgi:hypothetical protein